MKNVHFHEAYKQFMVIVVKRVQGLSTDQLKAPEKTARMLIKENFHKVLSAISKKSAHKKLNAKYPPIKVSKNHSHGKH
jgi:hypothetical protein